MSACASLDGATFVCLQVNVANSLGVRQEKSLGMRWLAAVREKRESERAREGLRKKEKQTRQREGERHKETGRERARE